MVFIYEILKIIFLQGSLKNLNFFENNIFNIYLFKKIYLTDNF